MRRHYTAAQHVHDAHAAGEPDDDTDPHQYFEEVLRVLPYWPRDRYLEPAAKHSSLGLLGSAPLAVEDTPAAAVS